MKIIVSLFAFALTLALTSPVLAEEGHGGGGHGNLAEKMNSLFPEKQPVPAKREVPAKPELSAPAYFSEVKGGTASLTWKAVAGADEYHVQVATDPNFKWLVANADHHKDTSFEATNLEAGKHYFWRVAAVNSNNWSTWRKSFFASSMFTTPDAK